MWQSLFIDFLEKKGMEFYKKIKSGPIDHIVNI